MFSYQGDGDLAAIGLCRDHSCRQPRARTSPIIFINNAVYGMTGGQMAPTTLIGQKTATSPEGRDPATMGPPIRMCELLNTLDKPYYIERVAIDSPAGVKKTRNAILTALQAQMDNKGYSFVEILTPCPVYQRLSPVEALKFVGNQMASYFPVRTFRDKGEVVHA